MCLAFLAAIDSSFGAEVLVVDEAHSAVFILWPQEAEGPVLA